MKTQLSKYVAAAIMLLTATQALQAQEAFYVYRNDGEFNGFFYDEVVRMGYSKLDYEGVEHDVYVMQEIQTEDSLYRIPLSVIDSIGFVQPEIILSKDLFEVNATGSPAQTGGRGYYFLGEDGYSIRWSFTSETQLPTSGMILYTPNWDNSNNRYAPDRKVKYDDGPFIGRVKTVAPDPDDKNWYIIVCEPINDLTEVFEQLISVEQIGTDGSKQIRRRMAGLDKVRRVSGNKDLTLVNLEGHFPFSRGNDDFEAKLSLDLSLKVRAQVAYNISRKVTYIGVDVKEDAEVGVSFTVKANLGEVTTWHLAGVPVYFPSILPIFQLDPSPQAFIKTTGDLSVSISSPKYAYHGTQSFHLGTDRVSGTCTNECPPPGSENNGWSMSVSLNGSMQAGSNFPMKLETNRWAEKGIYASIGADVFVGPKVSASFAVDPVALAKGEVYNSLSNTNITLSPMATVFEANAEYSFRNKPKTKTKFFEGERDFFQMQLKLFPDFEKPQVIEEPTDGTGIGHVKANIFPRGNSVPYYVGLACYNSKKELVSKTYNSQEDGKQHMYAFFNTIDEMPCQVSLLDGTYSIVPLLNAFGYDVPAWGSETQVKRNLLPYATLQRIENSKISIGYDPLHYYVYIGGLRPDDTVNLELEKSMQEDITTTITYYIDEYPGFVRERVKHDYKTSEGGGSASFIETDQGFKTVHQLGPEEGGYRYFSINNNCTYSRTEKGEKYKGIINQPPRDNQVPEGEYVITTHREACRYIVKVTRADGRSFICNNKLEFYSWKHITDNLPSYWTDSYSAEKPSEWK